MPPYRRSIHSVRIQLALAAEHGIGRLPLLAGTGITEAMLLQPDGEIDTEQELRLVCNLAKVTDNLPGFGLIAGRQYHLTTYGIWGFALASSPTIRAAIDLALRYRPLTFTFSDFRVSEADGQICIYMDDSALPASTHRYLAERDLAGVQQLFYEAMGTAIPLERVHFRFADPGYRERYTALFGVEPRFDQPDNLIAIDACFLDMPLPQANEHTRQMCEAMCVQLLQQRRARSGFSSQIRDRLARLPGQFPDMETVAAELGMTSRSLRRHLENEGTSYRQLIDEIREILAEQAIREGMAVEDIAGRLGYSEASSFIQAFKRWKGMSPKTYRVSLGGSGRVLRAPK